MTRKSLVSVSRFASLACGLVLATGAAFGQQAAPTAPKPTVNDWTDQHIVFGKAGTQQTPPPKLKRALQDRWQRQKDHQEAAAKGFNNSQPITQGAQGVLPSSNSTAQSGVSDTASITGPSSLAAAKAKPGTKPAGDWSVTLGPTAATNGVGSAVAANMYPAKFTFDLNAAPSCTTDYVVFGINTPGSTTGAKGTQTGTFTAQPGLTTTIDNTNASNSLVFSPVTSGSSVCSSSTAATYVVSGNLGTNADNFAAAINACNTSYPTKIGVTAVSDHVSTVTVTATTAGSTFAAGVHLSQATGSFHWNGTTLVGGSSAQPSIVGLNQLYSGPATPASADGTFTGDVDASGNIVITKPAAPNAGTLTLVPSPGSAAISTGTFSNFPTSTSVPSITINSGANQMTLTTNASPASSAVTFTQMPQKSSTFVLKNGSNTVTMTAASAASTVLQGTFNAPPQATDTFSVTDTPNGKTANLTTNAMAQTITGTFAGTPTSSTSVSVTIGANTATISDGQTAASDTGTFSGPGYGTTAGNITINAGSTFTFSPAGMAPSVIGTFSGNAAWSGTMTITPYTGATPIVFTPSSASTATINAVCITNTPDDTDCSSGGHSGSTGFLTFYINGSIPAAFVQGASVTITGLSPTSSLDGTYTICTNSGGNVCVGADGHHSYGNYFAVTVPTSTTNMGHTTQTSGTATVGSATNGCTSATAGTVATAASNNTQASNLYAAITSASCLSFGLPLTAANPGGSSPSVTITSLIPGSTANGITMTATPTTVTGNFVFAAVSPGNAGTQGCSGTTGLYTNSTTLNNPGVAGNLAATIGMCTSPGFTASATGAVVTVKSVAVGTGASLTVNAANPTNFGWTTKPSVTGTNGSNTCTGSSPSWTGTFTHSTYSNPATALATALAAAFNACTGLGIITPVTVSGSSVIVTPSTLGTSAIITISGSQTNAAGIYSWPSSTPGSNGSDACPTLASATFATDTTTTLIAGHMANALNACKTLDKTFDITAANNSTATVSVTANTSGYLTLSGAKSSAGFSWSTITGGNLGSNGTNANCAFVSGTNWAGTFSMNAGATTIPTLSSVATQFVSALNQSACLTALGIAAPTSSTSTVTVTANVLGTSDSPTGSSISDTNFTWTNTAGSNGSTSCTTLATAHFAFASTPTLPSMAQNAASAIHSCAVAFPAMGVDASWTSGNGFTVTALSRGTASNSIALAGGVANLFTWGSTNLTSTTLGGTGTTHAGTPGTQSNSSAGTHNFDTSSTNPTTEAANLAALLNVSGIGSSIGLGTTTVNGTTVTVVDATAGTDGNTVELSFGGSNFAWATPTLTGGSAVGLCNPTGPAVMFSYVTGTSGPVATSPVISYKPNQGQKIAFVESIATGSKLHILRPATAALAGTTPDGTIAAPTVLTPITDGTTWANCLSGTGACLFDITYNSAANTTSSPYVDYDSDVLWVGGADGTLFRVTGVFNGTPTLDTTDGAWSGGVSVDSGGTPALTGPVYDGTYVYVGSGNGVMEAIEDLGGSPGFSYGYVGGGTDFSSISSPPIVDGFFNTVLWFGVQANTTTARVVQTDPTLTASVVSVPVGTIATPQIYSGFFNNAYFSDPNSNDWFLYVCGHDQGGASYPTLYSIGYTASGILANSITGSLQLAATTTPCTPLSTIENTTQGINWLFTGLQSGCPTTPSTGCAVSLNINAFPAGLAAAGVASGGTSAIVVDNVSGSGKASSLYYSTQTSTSGTANCQDAATGGACAVQRTQAGLQ